MQSFRKTYMRRISLSSLAVLASMALLMLFNVSVQAATLLVSAVDKNGDPLPDVAVYLIPASGSIPEAAPTEVIVAQEGMQFNPYLTVIRTGSKVIFPNRDKKDHHVKSFSEAKEFELKIYSSGLPPPITFDKPGVVALHCLIHDWMRGFIYVVDTPWYSITDATGSGRVTNFPDGKYEVRAWHPDMGSYIPPLSQSVVVSKDGATVIKFAFDLKPKKRKPPRETS